MQALVLSFVTPATLDLGRNSVAQIPYQVVARPPEEGTLLRFLDGALRDQNSPPLALNVTIDGHA